MARNIIQEFIHNQSRSVWRDKCSITTHGGVSMVMPYKKAIYRPGYQFGEIEAAVIANEAILKMMGG